MQPPLDSSWDAIVVGAGPGGAATAYHLAARQRKVLLLDRSSFPRDKSCGDGLTPAAVRHLAEMGVLTDLPQAFRVRGARMIMRGRGSRDFLYPDEQSENSFGLVVPRFLLDEAIVRRAVSAGAILKEKVEVERLLWEDDRAVGAEVRLDNGQTCSLRAQVIVAADGAASRLARQAGLRPRLGADLGVAMRGYFETDIAVGDLLEIYLPITDVTDQYVLPSYGWVFPTGVHSANIGVGLFQSDHAATVRELYYRFVEQLFATDGRFASARPSSAVRAAPLSCNFAPDRCARPGLLLVGDAAGLVSPFTGEGISYALESGKLAAETIDRSLRIRGNAESVDTDYPLLLENRYAGYFEVGRRSNRRYLLIWHVLESTFQSDRPIFDLCRRLILIPEGTSGATGNEYLEDVKPLLPRHGLSVDEGLMAVGSLLTDVVRKDWPFLARLSLQGRQLGSATFRPALFLLIAAHFGDPKRARLAELGAAMELGYLSFLAQTGLEEEVASDGPVVRTTSWGNKFAILLSDFLLSKAQELCASAAPRASELFAHAIGQACAGCLREARHAHDAELSETQHLEILQQKSGCLFELPCILGADWEGRPEAAAALSQYGRKLGVAYTLTEDLRTYMQLNDRVESALASDLSLGIYSLPLLRALQTSWDGQKELHAILRQKQVDRDRLAELLRSSGALESVKATAEQFVEEAKESVLTLPEGPARAALVNLAGYAVKRQIFPIVDLSELLTDNEGVE